MDQPPPPAWRTELKILLSVALPVAATRFCRSGQMLTDQAVLGRLADGSGKPTALFLDAAALAELWQMLTFQCITAGIGGAEPPGAVQCWPPPPPPPPTAAGGDAVGGSW